ncbi:hypothetical protein FH608_023075 [Nonomuraea phyllanthi]|uniref:Uncharacterized protein n=1 Tax=Nonomuraea phyllanthi TaxID=2219224 RepID=A0A5C4WCS7_9ACTN|nr:hypothetical protein [Nonomuraea phyllanthi]KAB8193185.1 hypothetical protein FH608_023075 [Nonomuraea phyllanthi]
MAFDPLRERGIPLDEQPRDWRALDVPPIDPDHADPYTRCRIIAMNGIETEAIFFSHHLARHCPDTGLRQELAKVRSIEAQQQKAVNWLLSGVSSVLETTLAYEQTAVELTAWVARMEPDATLRQAYQFGLLEHVDHLYRYANLYETLEHRGADKIVDGLTEVMPGRPTSLHHRDPMDNVREPYRKRTTEPLSRLHALTVMAVEQQTMNFHMTAGPMFAEPAARRLYQEVALVEEGHVTHYESLADPGESWWEMLLNHEYNECYLYHSFVETESDPRVRSVWELHLAMELEHLRLAAELFKRFDGRDPDQVLAPACPPPVTFEPNRAYLRDLAATQGERTTLGTGYVEGVHERFQRAQETIMGGEPAPSQRVVEDNRAVSGQEYVLETEGPRPAGVTRA